MTRKVILLILTTVLSAALLSGCTAFFKEDPAKPAAPTPQAADATPEATAAPEETPTPAVTATETPEPEATPEVTATPEPTPDPAAEAAAEEAPMYKAYAEQLLAHREEIARYNWQMADGRYHYPPDGETSGLAPVALADVWGNESPELIYLHAPGEGMAALSIYGWENDALKELCVIDQWDVSVASGTHFCLFQTTEEKTLYGYTVIGSSLGYYNWYRFDEEGGLLRPNDIASAELDWTGEDPSNDTYNMNGQPSSVASYDGFIRKLLLHVEEAILCSAELEYTENSGYMDRLCALPSAGMSFEKALQALNEKLPAEEKVDLAALPTATPTPLPTPTPVPSVTPADTTAASGMLFADSSTRLLTEGEVQALTTEQAQMAINEIYARHGFAFQTPAIRSHFEAFDWYTASESDMDRITSLFSEVESQNIQLLSGKL